MNTRIISLLFTLAVCLFIIWGGIKSLQTTKAKLEQAMLVDRASKAIVNTYRE